jgi:adenylate cyclase
MRIPIADLQAAGLYDPAAPGAADRLALLEWLAGQGATLRDMTEAASEGSLVELAGVLSRRLDRPLTLTDLAARANLPAERIQAIRFAAGLPPVGPDEPAFADADAAIFVALDLGEELFGKEAMRRFVQVLGSSLARMAEAAISLSLVNVEGPMRSTGKGELALAQARSAVIGSVAPLTQAIARLFAAHIDAAARRLRRALPRGSVDTAPLAVGFVDLVGFTTLARQVAPGALASIIERFEETAHDVTARCQGRVVKFIGDEVMFVTRDEATACDVALTLIERFTGDGTVTPRGGLAAGELLVRGGDYYGPLVNLAARLADVAVPREVLVTAEVAAAAASGGLRFEPAGQRLLKGFDKPMRLFTVERDAR